MVFGMNQGLIQLAPLAFVDVSAKAVTVSVTPVTSRIFPKMVDSVRSTVTLTEFTVEVVVHDGHFTVTVTPVVESIVSPISLLLLNTALARSFAPLSVMFGFCTNA